MVHNCNKCFSEFPFRPRSYKHHQVLCDPCFLNLRMKDYIWYYPPKCDFSTNNWILVPIQNVNSVVIRDCLTKKEVYSFKIVGDD